MQKDEASPLSWAIYLLLGVISLKDNRRKQYQCCIIGLESVEYYPNTAPKLGVTLVTVFRGGLYDESRRGRGETLTSDSQGDKNLGIQIYNGNITLAPRNGGSRHIL